MNSKIKATLRKFLSIALAALILAGCAGAAFADGSDASGTVNGVDWVYTSADKTLVLSGSGTLGEDVADFGLFGGSWVAEHVKIGADVNITTGRVFENFDFVDEYEVDANNKYLCNPDGVLMDKDKTVLIKYPAGSKEFSFYTVPDTVKTISYRAFEFSSALKTIFLNDGLETIENFAFDNCGNLLYITIPGTVTSMGKGVLAQCNLLNKVTIEEGVTAIPEDAFDRCRSLETVNLPDSLTTIGDIAFFGCTKLKTLKLPKNLQTFTDSPGRNFGGLNIALTVDPENQYFCTDDLGVLYNKDKTLLYFCPNLPYTFDYTVRCNLNEYAFSGCENLRNVDIDYNLRAIPKNAFYNCKNLNTVTLPATLQRIDGAAFNASLKTVNYRGTEELWKLITIDSFSNDAIKSATVVYNYGEPEEPDEITLSYDQASNTLTIAGSGVLTLNDIKKWNYTNLNTSGLKVKIGKNVNITDAKVFCDTLWPFYYMKSFEVDSLNPYLSSLNGVLYNKDKTKLIRFPSGNTTADYDVVECSVASTVKEIAPYAFKSAGVTDVYLPNGLETIGQYAFDGASKLIDITIPYIRKT